MIVHQLILFPLPFLITFSFLSWPGLWICRVFFVSTIVHRQYKNTLNRISGTTIPLVPAAELPAAAAEQADPELPTPLMQRNKKYDIILYWFSFLWTFTFLARKSLLGPSIRVCVLISARQHDESWHAESKTQASFVNFDVKIIQAKIITEKINFTNKQYFLLHNYCYAKLLIS